jgi:hypothetical protein
LWRWYINITIAILDTVHCPVFYLKHMMDNFRTTQETQYVSAVESNRLIKSVDLWLIYINITTGILDTVHCPVICLKRTTNEELCLLGCYAVWLF